MSVAKPRAKKKSEYKIYVFDGSENVEVASNGIPSVSIERNGQRIVAKGHALWGASQQLRIEIYTKLGNHVLATLDDTGEVLVKENFHSPESIDSPGVNGLLRILRQVQRWKELSKERVWVEEIAPQVKSAIEFYELAQENQGART